MYLNKKVILYSLISTKKKKKVNYILTLVIKNEKAINKDSEVCNDYIYSELWIDISHFK